SVLLLGLGGLPGGLSAGKAVESEAALTASDSALAAGLRLHDTVVSAYTELVGDGSWEPVLSCGDAPVLMTKATDGGRRFTVCSFDLHDSNLPMKPDFALLMKNIVDFSVPALLRDRDYTVGDTVTFGVSDEAEALFVTLPDGTVQPLTIVGDHAMLRASAVGLHTALMQSADGGDYADFFVGIPPGESARAEGGSLSLTLPEPTESAADAESGIWLWIAALLLLLILAEWGCYYYEQI
ncbi:MAG: hypothetical protein IJF67_06635, partial [Clostridia bacterium]|nr:hypothetical protein [Clostridia bacterium]